ncbi:MAG: ParA family protein, partial [Vitreimonas sp.]
MPSTGKVVCVANRKGGVGKTTATVVIAHTLQQAGRSVAVIDVDPQSSATYALAGEKLAQSMSSIMLEGMIQRENSFPVSRPIEDFSWGQISTLTNRPDVPIALIPCSPALWDLEDKLSDRVFNGSMSERWNRLLTRL